MRDLQVALPTADGANKRLTKVIRRKAERVLAARLQLLKDRIAAAQVLAQLSYTPDSRAEREAKSRDIHSLQTRERELREAGVDAVLKEFGK